MIMVKKKIASNNKENKMNIKSGSFLFYNKNIKILFAYSNLFNNKINNI